MSTSRKLLLGLKMIMTTEGFLNNNHDDILGESSLGSYRQERLQRLSFQGFVSVYSNGSEETIQKDLAIKQKIMEGIC